METINSFLARWEPLWLFLLIGFEGLVALYSAWILTVEFNYDKEWNERKAARRKRIIQAEIKVSNEGEMK